MRVRELAVDLKVKPDILVRFLRKSGVRVGHPDAPIKESDVARIRIRLERERRAGKGSAADVMRADLKGSVPVSRRRRGRRRRAPAAEIEARDGGAVAVEELPADAAPQGLAIDDLPGTVAGEAGSDVARGHGRAGPDPLWPREPDSPKRPRRKAFRTDARRTAQPIGNRGKRPSTAWA